MNKTYSLSSPDILVALPTHKSESQKRARWYNMICHIYSILGDHYKDQRIQMIEKLNLTEGDIVIDLCSGTGRNFEYILPKIGRSGKLIAIDISKGMLNKAKEKYKNENVYFLNTDAQELTAKKIQEVVPEFKKANKVICTLGLTVVPNFKKTFFNSYQLLNPAGVYAILDLYFERNTLISRIIDFYACSDSTRLTLKYLEENSSSFLKSSTSFYTGNIVSMVGTKSVF